MKVAETFANNLKALREERNLSQNELAEQIGISRGSISFYENGSRLPDIEILNNFCKFFDVSADYMLGRTNIKEYNLGYQYIQKEIGISEETIKLLSKKKAKYFLSKTIDYILETNILSLISNYFFSFLRKDVSKGKYKAIPKIHSFQFLEQLSFSFIIEKLPKAKNEIEENVRENKTLLKEMTDKYIVYCADMEKCNKNLRNLEKDLGMSGNNDYFEKENLTYNDEEFENYLSEELSSDDYENYISAKLQTLELLEKIIKEKEGETNGEHKEKRE